MTQPNPNAPTPQPVLDVHHWTDRLFSFRLERPESFRFRSGEFVMLGLPTDSGKPLLRAYSITSPSWEEALEFYSIKVPNGPLTSRLQHIQPGEAVLLARKPVGTLVLDALTPGKRLYLFSTGTGIAPFCSLVREPETYEKFEQVILTHTCRDVADLQYGRSIVDVVRNHEFLSELANGKLLHYETTTRETSARMGRVTQLIESQKLFSDLSVPPLNPETDRVMICGSTQMTLDTKLLCEKAGLTEGANSQPAEFVVERAFVG